MARSIKRFRLFIICLALISFILGIIVNSKLELPSKLLLMLISEALTVISYSIFAFGSKKKPQRRGVRIFIRAVLVFLTLYGPVDALRECDYSLRRDYDQKSPGIHTFEQLGCVDFGQFRPDEEGEKTVILPTFRLFRARCIITLTVCALVFVEMFLYGWSNEALGLQQDGDASAKTTPDDIELGDTSTSEPQKMELPGPPHAIK